MQEKDRYDNCDMNEREYQRLKAQIEKEYKEKLRALEMVWQIARPSLQKNGPRPPRRETGKGKLLNTVREALYDLSGDFTIREIEQWIRRNRPELIGTSRPTISGALRRLAEAGEIVVVKVGIGKRPSIYRKSEQEMKEERGGDVG